MSEREKRGKDKPHIPKKSSAPKRKPKPKASHFVGLVEDAELVPADREARVFVCQG